MEDNLITVVTAKLAKEKGFNIPTRNFYADESWKDEQVYACNEVGYPEYTSDMENNHSFGDITLIPTQSLLQKWLREKHNIMLIIAPIHETEESSSLIKYWYYILDIEDISDDEVFYGNWEEALEKGLQEALKLIKI